MEEQKASYRTKQLTRQQPPRTLKRPPFEGKCTFCGAPMEPGETVCEECGMPADGVVCPNCGTLNFRPFCSHCNTPLNRAALRAVEKAMEDPKVQEAARLMDQAAKLEEALESAPDETAKAEAQETYRQVVKDINQPDPPPKNSSTTIPPEGWPSSVSRRSNGPSEPNGCATTADAITASPANAWNLG